ncbi:MAG: diguanylate cyclase [Geobacter sp.]|nr:diguanylate cyclase [Geobacter sp.]
MNTILVVEDDRLFREMFTDLLTNEGYQVDCASCGSEALAMLASGSYDLVVTDLVMPDINGLEILSRVRESYPWVDVIMVTGNANLESAIYALKHGASDYLVKPVNSDEFKHSVAQCMQQRKLLDENEELKKMLTLFQASQTIAGCLDISRVYQLLIDSIARETGINRALGFFLAGGKLELNETKNISPESGNILAAEILSALSDSPPVQQQFQRIRLISPDTPDGFSEAYLVHIYNQTIYRGVIALFNDIDQELPDISPFSKNIIFLIEQSANAFANAESFSHAKEMLFIDDISGLFNHRYLDIALEREMKRVERYASHLAILFIDVDGFKSVNDTHGHLVGSRVLAEFGALLKKSVRDVDVVIRYGGDEYTAILVETPCELAEVVAERIRRQVEAHLFLHSEGRDIRLTCSIGYACCPDDATKKEELIEMADKAMYVGKASGKNCIQRIDSIS